MKSEPSLLREVRRFGTFDAQACLQCGSCTVSCDLVDRSASFPRRTLRVVLLGLKEQLLRGLEPWLCYYCGDCSKVCPRQAEPAESLMTLRRYLTAQYDLTGLSARIQTSRVWHLGSLLVAGALVVVLFVLYHLYFGGLELDDLVGEPMGLEHMFGRIVTFTLGVVLLSFLLLGANAWRMMRLALHGPGAARIPAALYFSEARIFLVHAVTQRRFRDCKEGGRWPKHVGLLVFGCVLMFVLVVGFLTWFQTDELYPLSHPQRWLGYLATVALVWGSVDILIARSRRRMEMHRFSERSDVVLPVLLLLTALSGIAVHIFRYAELLLVTHYAYLLHIAIAVPLMLIELPFGKLSHVLYRPLALYSLRLRERALEAERAGVPEGMLADHAR